MLVLDGLDHEARVHLVGQLELLLKLGRLLLEALQLLLEVRVAVLGLAHDRVLGLQVLLHVLEQGFGLKLQGLGLALPILTGLLLQAASCGSLRCIRTSEMLDLYFWILTQADS